MNDTKDYSAKELDNRSEEDVSEMVPYEHPPAPLMSESEKRAWIVPERVAPDGWTREGDEKFPPHEEIW